MFVSYNWLKEFVDFNLSPQQLAERLTMIGLEVETVQPEGDDWILNLEITPNRGDCASILGVAREVLGLGLGGKINYPSRQLAETEEETRTILQVEVREPQLCPRYTARLIRGVNPASRTPEPIARRISSAGINPVNQVVDLTNYVMLELGQPLHAFDFDKVGQKKIIVRLAQKGEKVVLLDGKERTLSPEMLVIADGQKPIALAGIMGGEETAVNQDTETVLLESAYFDPKSIRRTAKKLEMVTESSYRFEREVDINNVPRALERVTGLIQTNAGGEATKGITDVYPKPFTPVKIDFRPEKVNNVLGTKISSQQMESILSSLGFTIQPRPRRGEAEGGQSAISNRQSAIGNPQSVIVPSFRHDITGEIDLIEEIGRIYGYQNIPLTPPRIKFRDLPEEKSLPLLRLARKILTGIGFSEVINYSFIGKDALARLKVPADSGLKKGLKLANPLQEEENFLRTSLIPGLISTLLWNIHHGTENLKIFEIGRVFRPRSREELPEEKNLLSAGVIGLENERWWGGKSPEWNFFDFSGVVQTLLEQVGVRALSLDRAAVSFLHPAQQAAIKSGDICFGTFGQLHPLVARDFGFDQKVFIFELDISKILSYNIKEGKFTGLSKFVPLRRDIALIVAEVVPCAEVKKFIQTYRAGSVEKVELFDVYKGRDGPAGKRSLAFTVFYRNPEGNSSTEQINQLHAELGQALENKFQARVRKPGRSAEGSFASR